MGDQQQNLFTENVKQHPVYKNLFISETGNVYKKDGSVKYCRVGKAGYVETQTKIKGKVKTLKVHHLVAETFLPTPPESLVEKCSQEHWWSVIVKHIDNDKTNNNVMNLQWSDAKENTQGGHGVMVLWKV